MIRLQIFHSVMTTKDKSLRITGTKFTRKNGKYATITPTMPIYP